MIKAVAFDMDGTLVRTEMLKARSYARAVREMCPNHPPEEDVVAFYKTVVGQSRHDVAIALMDEFSLWPAARTLEAMFDVREPWQAFVQMRLRYYRAMLNDPYMLRSHRQKQAVKLAKDLRREGLKIALATMSSCESTNMILKALDLSHAFDAVITADDIEHTKPDAEIYTVVAHTLEVEPAECLVIEDSATGLQAALAAGMPCVVVPTPLTIDGLRNAPSPDSVTMVDDSNALADVVHRVIQQHTASVPTEAPPS